MVNPFRSTGIHLSKKFIPPTQRFSSIPFFLYASKPHFVLKPRTNMPITSSALKSVLVGCRIGGLRKCAQDRSAGRGDFSFAGAWGT